MRLSIDEVKCLPHIVSFRCGTRVLVSVRGRPPLCLRCMTMGHMRRDCGTDAGARRTISAPVPPTMSEVKVWQETAAQDTPAEPSQLGEPEVPITPVTPVTAEATPAMEAGPLQEPLADDSSVSPDVESSPQLTPVVQTVRGKEKSATQTKMR